MTSITIDETTLIKPTTQFQPSAFARFAKLINERYERLTKFELFVVGTDNHAFSDTYLAAFPEGTNPVYKTNTEHGCSCCKNFIRHIGNVVAIVDGQMQTVWDIADAPFPYGVVAKHMNEFVLNQPITGLFRTAEPKYGAVHTMQHIDGGVAFKWNHLYGDVHKNHRSAEPATKIGEYNAAVQVLRRGLDELKISAIEEVLELIESKALYRGEEHEQAVRRFGEALRTSVTLTPKQRELFIWANASQPWARFRNTVIGTLVTDLSAGVDIETAVRSFEAKVAPTNYKRPTAVITPMMIKAAMTTIKELDLEQALERRFARIDDVNVNDVLWVNNSARKLMKGGLEDILMSTVFDRAIKLNKNVVEVSIDEFMNGVLPHAQSIELLVKNEHSNNFMTLTAPVHDDSGKLFKWRNDFAWSYEGNVTDSIKERVKKAGGSVVGDVCCRLAWDYTDDLDFHMFEPTGHHIYFGNRCSLSTCGGILDLDANGADGQRDDPAENIVYSSRGQMKDGIYNLRVNNYSRRSTNGQGFTVEIEVDSKINTLNYPSVLRNGETIDVADIVKKGNDITVVPFLPSTTTPRQIWGITTESFVPVKSLMYSPNYWGSDAVGNKHWFFVLEDCKTVMPVRGIYNEFLNSSLEKHRKVFEVLGDKTKCPPTDDQLSGLGFSSTRTESVHARVTGANGTQTFKITF